MIPLQSHAGEVHLSDFKNQLILLSFGYTHCPDVCPATLLHVSQALNLLSIAERKKVQAIFFSVDPQRDTPELLNKYVQYFHNDMIAVNAEGLNYSRFLKAFNIESQQLSDDPNYEISHTSYLFLLGDDAKVLDIMGHETAAKFIAEAIRKHLKD
ncbi:MAG: SCO family protein [Mariprofundaceae bacterium]|nr:SCO family protein [Mariprofundaceae bacterium]